MLWHQSSPGSASPDAFLQRIIVHLRKERTLDRAIKRPERVAGIISQNGNAYEEGQSDTVILASTDASYRDALRSLLSDPLHRTAVA
jgi:hypothetical protein